MYREGTTVQYGVQWTTRLRGSPGLTVRRRCTTTWAVALLPARLRTAGGRTMPGRSVNLCSNGKRY